MANEAQFADQTLTTAAFDNQKLHLASIEELINALAPTDYDQLERNIENTRNILTDSLAQDVGFSAEEASAILLCASRGLRRALKAEDWRIGRGLTRMDATIPEVAAALMLSSIDLLIEPFEDRTLRAYRNRHHDFVEAMARFAEQAGGGLFANQDFYQQLGMKVAGAVLDHKIVSNEPQLAAKSTDYNAIEAAALEQLVYFIQCGQEGPIKIGIARDPAGRLATLQTGHFETLHLRAITVGGMDQERAYHARFGEHHQRGEWFSPHPDILTEIERLCSLAK